MNVRVSQKVLRVLFFGVCISSCGFVSCASDCIQGIQMINRASEKAECNNGKAQREVNEAVKKIRRCLRSGSSQAVSMLGDEEAVAAADAFTEGLSITELTGAIEEFVNAGGLVAYALLQTESEEASNSQLLHMIELSSGTPLSSETELEEALEHLSRGGVGCTLDDDDDDDDDDDTIKEACESLEELIRECNRKGHRPVRVPQDMIDHCVNCGYMIPPDTRG